MSYGLYSVFIFTRELVTVLPDDVIEKASLKVVSPENKVSPSREEALQAVKTLLQWLGDDPQREGLLKTPNRVINSFEELFSGYGQDAGDILTCRFADVAGYDEPVLVKNIALFSHCEHHMLPIIGKAHIAYLPNGGVVGISKLARLVEVFGRRLQTQETLTAQIADAIDEYLRPQGVAVLIDAEHQCMSMRGVNKLGASTVTTKFTGVFREQVELRNKFLRMVDYGK